MSIIIRIKDLKNLFYCNYVGRVIMVNKGGFFNPLTATLFSYVLKKKIFNKY